MKAFFSISLRVLVILEGPIARCEKDASPELKFYSLTLKAEGIYELAFKRKVV